MSGHTQERQGSAQLPATFSSVQGRPPGDVQHIHHVSEAWKSVGDVLTQRLNMHVLRAAGLSLVVEHFQDISATRQDVNVSSYGIGRHRPGCLQSNEHLLQIVKTPVTPTVHILLRCMLLHRLCRLAQCCPGSVLCMREHRKCI